MVLYDVHTQLCARVFTRRIHGFLIALVFSESIFSMPIPLFYDQPDARDSVPVFADDHATFQGACMSNVTQIALGASTIGVEVGLGGVALRPILALIVAIGLEVLLSSEWYLNLERDAARGLLGAEERGAAWIGEERERRKLTALKGREALKRSRLRVKELHKVFEKYREKFDPSSHALGPAGMSSVAATPITFRRQVRVAEGEFSSSLRPGDGSLGDASAARLDRVDSVIPLEELDSIWDKAADVEVVWAGDDAPAPGWVSGDFGWERKTPTKGTPTAAGEDAEEAGEEDGGEGIEGVLNAARSWSMTVWSYAMSRFTELLDNTHVVAVAAVVLHHAVHSQNLQPQFLHPEP
jgi:hypothetical protein